MNVMSAPCCRPLLGRRRRFFKQVCYLPHAPVMHTSNGQWQIRVNCFLWIFVFFLPAFDRFELFYVRRLGMQTKRQAELLRLLEESGTLSITSLAERLMVSAETVRRDVRTLSEIGEVHRMHGGVSLPTPQGESPFRRRMRENATAKQAIARVLAAKIRNGDTLMFDTGTTTSYVARALVGHTRLTVVTNSTDAARTLAGGAGNRVLLAGGELRPDSGAVVGHQALDFIGRHAAHYAVISAGAVRNGEVMDYDTGEAILAKAMLSRSDRGVLVTDATKFGKRGLAVVCRYDGLNEIVTDATVSADEARLMAAARVNLTVASDGSTDQMDHSNSTEF